MSQYIVYLLTNSVSNRTYLGITNNPKRRIRQHNGELKGGAKYTHSFKGDGYWDYKLHITNLSKSQALSIERTIKNKRNQFRGKEGLSKKIDTLSQMSTQYEHSQIIFFDDIKDPANEKIDVI
jgi:predicted GIY-YIG superfamily endonuclease